MCCLGCPSPDPLATTLTCTMLCMTQSFPAAGVVRLPCSLKSLPSLLCYLALQQSSQTSACAVRLGNALYTSFLPHCLQQCGQCAAEFAASVIAEAQCKHMQTEWAHSTPAQATTSKSLSAFCLFADQQVADAAAAVPVTTVEHQQSEDSPTVSFCTFWSVLPQHGDAHQAPPPFRLVLDAGTAGVPLTIWYVLLW